MRDCKSSLVIRLFVISMVFVCLAGCGSKQLIEELNSPDGSYRAKIFRESGSGLFGDYRNINLTTNNGTQDFDFPVSIWQEISFIAGERSKFEELYPDRFWLDNRILFLGVRERLEIAKGTVTISNRSHKTIRQLKVDVIGNFLIYNIKPGEEITLHDPLVLKNHQGDMWASAEGDFDDRTTLGLVLERFVPPEKSEDANITVYVANKDIVIHSNMPRLKF